MKHPVYHESKIQYKSDAKHSHPYKHVSVVSNIKAFVSMGLLSCGLDVRTAPYDGRSRLGERGGDSSMMTKPSSRSSLFTDFCVMSMSISGRDVRTLLTVGRVVQSTRR